jgi:hypothetical protein
MSLKTAFIEKNNEAKLTSFLMYSKSYYLLNKKTLAIYQISEEEKNYEF